MTDHRGVIFGQVAVGCAMSDVVQSFGIQPQAVIGYSLGESAGLFALQAWRDRDRMLERMERSTLFTRDLAGECRAAQPRGGSRRGEPSTGSSASWKPPPGRCAALSRRRRGSIS